MHQLKLLFKPANEKDHSSTLVIPDVMHCNWNFGDLLDKMVISHCQQQQSYSGP